MAPKKRVGPKSKAAQIENVTVRKISKTETSELESLMEDITKNEEVVSSNNGDLNISSNDSIFQKSPEILSNESDEEPIVFISNEELVELIDKKPLPKKKIIKSQNDDKIKKIRKRAASADPIDTNEIVIMKPEEHNVDMKKKKNNKKAVANEDDKPMQIMKNTKTKKTTKREENDGDIREIIQEESVQEEPAQEEPLQEKPKYKRGGKQQEPVELPVKTRTRGIKAKQIVDKPKAASSKPKKNLKAQKSEENDSDIEDVKPKRAGGKQGMKSLMSSSDDSGGNNDLSDSEKAISIKIKQVNSDQTNVPEKPKRGRRVKNKEPNDNDSSPSANDGEVIKTGNLPDGLPNNPESGKHDVKPTAVKRKAKAKPAKK